MHNTSSSFESILTVHPVYPDVSNPASTATPLETDIEGPRNFFVQTWRELVEIEYRYTCEKNKQYQTVATTEKIRQLEEEKKEIIASTSNALHRLAYSELKDILAVPENIKPETLDDSTKNLKEYITLHGGEHNRLDRLMHEIQIIHGKEKEFLVGTNAILQKEVLIQQITIKKQIEDLKLENSNLIKQLDRKTKNPQNTIQQLQHSNELLQQSLEQAQSGIVKLNLVIGKAEETEKHYVELLKKREENTSYIEREGQESINKLEGEITQLKERCTAADKKEKDSQARTKQLDDKRKELEISFEKTKLEKSNLLKNRIELIAKNKNLEKEIEEIQQFSSEQEERINQLEGRIEEYKRKEVYYLETEDINNSQAEDKQGEVTKIIEQINDLTSPIEIDDRSLLLELDVEQLAKLQQTIKLLQKQVKSQFETITTLQERNKQQKEKYLQNKMGKTHDISNEAGISKDEPEISAEDTTIMNNLTKPIVRVLGELLSREDKKSITPYKGKSTDKLIIEWLKNAEHVARNNNWDDEQKLRFFSDRLRGEAMEWHEEYLNEQGSEIDYKEWKQAIIARFQDAYDLATLKKKLLKLKQKPEENCRAFISRLNSLYDSLEGKEEKIDHDKTVFEDQLLIKVKKMRDATKIKILLQGIVPKIKSELYLRMPEDTNDFDALCKQLFISEQILQNKENNDDNELSAVIAGITHHEKQQDKELSQQKTEIELLTQKLLEMECANQDRELPQETTATIAGVDSQPRRVSAEDHPSRSDYRKVTFQNRQPPSRESSYSGSRDSSFTRNREASPYRRSENSYESGNRGPTREYQYRNNRPNYFNQQRPRYQNQNFSQNHIIQQRNNLRNSSDVYRNFENNNQYQPRIQLPVNDQQIQRNREKVCHKCQKKGHTARECWTDMARINQHARRSM